MKLDLPLLARTFDLQPRERVIFDGRLKNGTSTTAGTAGCSEGEDCLFLDVWAPSNAVEGGEKLPVLFWNYGGGWVSGSKNEETPEVFH